MNGRTPGLVVLAVLAGALFLDRAQRLVPVYAAARDLPAGTSLRNGDLMVVRVRLPTTALRHYLQPSLRRLLVALVWTAPVQPGLVLAWSRWRRRHQARARRAQYQQREPQVRLEY